MTAARALPAAPPGWHWRSPRMLVRALPPPAPPRYSARPLPRPTMPLLPLLEDIPWAEPEDVVLLEPLSAVPAPAPVPAKRRGASTVPAKAPAPVEVPARPAEQAPELLLEPPRPPRRRRRPKASSEAQLSLPLLEVLELPRPPRRRSPKASGDGQLSLSLLSEIRGGAAA